MEIRIKIPKIVYEDSNLSRLKRTISTGYYLRSATGTPSIGKKYHYQGLSPSILGNDFIRVYNIVKINAVRKRDSNGDYKKVSPTRYIANVYDIPISVIKEGGLLVVQQTRNFKIMKFEI